MAAAELLAKGSRRLAVLDENKHVVGMLTHSRILQFLFDHIDDLKGIFD
jgi:hypothetical protein